MAPLGADTELLELHALPAVPQPAALARAESSKSHLGALSPPLSGPAESPISPLSSFAPTVDLLFESAVPIDAQALPPVDRGRGAWIFLASSTAIEMLVWMLPWGIGVLHNYWTGTLFKDYGPGAESTLTLAATLMSGLMYMYGAFMGP